MQFGTLEKSDSGIASTPHILAVVAIRSCILISGGLFLIAGISKLIEPGAVTEAFSITGLGDGFVTAVTWGLPPFEILVGIALILGRVKGIVLAMLLLVVFSGYLVYLLILGQNVSCGCFGRIAGQLSGTSAQMALVRNGVLVLLLAASLAFHQRRSGRAVKESSPESARNSRHTRLRTLFLLGSTICFSGALTPGPVYAQWIGSSVDPGLPYFSSGDREDLIQRLDASHEQRVVLEDFFGNWEKERQKLLSEWQDSRVEQEKLIEKKQLTDEDRQPQLATLLRRSLQIARQLRTLEESLNRDVRLLLEPDQVEKFEEFLRNRRRARLAEGPTYFGEEQVDLVALTRALEIDDDERVSEMLGQYSRSIDDLIRKRNDMIQRRLELHYENRLARLEGRSVENPEHQEDMGAIRTLDRNDYLAYVQKMRLARRQKVLDQRRPEMEVRKKIRDLNRTYHQMIVSVLAPDDAIQMQAAFRHVAFPEFYPSASPIVQPFNAHRYIQQALQLETLSSEQRASIEAFSQSYYDRFDSVARRLVRSRVEGEEDWEENMLRGGLDPRIVKRRMRLLQTRRELQENTISHIRTLLTEEQRCDVPEPQDESGW